MLTPSHISYHFTLTTTLWAECCPWDIKSLDQSHRPCLSGFTPRSVRFEASITYVVFLTSRRCWEEGPDWLFHVKTHHKSLICFSLLLCKKCEVQTVCLRQSTGGDSGSHSPPLEKLWHWSYGQALGSEHTALRWDRRIHSHWITTLYPSQQAVWQWTVCLWVVIPGSVSWQPRNGLVPSFTYILFSAVFFATCLHRKSLRESQTKQEVICSQIKGTRRMKMGRIRKRGWLTRPRSYLVVLFRGFYAETPTYFRVSKLCTFKSKSVLNGSHWLENETDS